MKEADKRSNDNKVSLIERIKGIKHLDILIAIVAIVVILAIYFGISIPKKGEVIKGTDSDADFVANIERVLSRIDGAGHVSVIINYSDDTTKEIAHRVESVTKVDKDGTTSVIEEKREPIIIRNGKDNVPIILRDSANSIKGVVVVASGANDVHVRLDILSALTTLLDISADKIRVYSAD